MPIAFIAQTSFVWKELGIVLGAVLAAVAVVRIFGSPIAEKIMLWVLREQIKRWDSGSDFAKQHADKTEQYTARARGWDVGALLIEANKDRVDACFASIQAQGAEMRKLERSVERCEGNAGTLDEIKDEVRETHKALIANAIEIAAVKAILAERRGFVRRDSDRKE